MTRSKCEPEKFSERLSGLRIVEIVTNPSESPRAGTYWDFCSGAQEKVKSSFTRIRSDASHIASDTSSLDSPCSPQPRQSSHGSASCSHASETWRVREPPAESADLSPAQLPHQENSLRNTEDPAGLPGHERARSVHVNVLDEGPDAPRRATSSRVAGFTSRRIRRG